MNLNLNKHTVHLMVSGLRSILMPAHYTLVTDPLYVLDFFISMFFIALNLQALREGCRSQFGGKLVQQMYLR